MSNPTLDSRTTEHLMAQLAQRIGQYTPEWRYEPDGKDPGAAIAGLFGEMFYQTIDRLNQIPQKLYVEFLNLLGVAPPTVTPARGFVAFEIGGASEAPVAIPEGTEVFAKLDDDEENIVYETERPIEATGASLEDIFYVDVSEGRIERADLSGEVVFFDTAGGENLQSHRFAVSQNEALDLSGPCVIDVTLRQTAGFLEERTAKKLEDAGFASWSYWNGAEFKVFDSVIADNGALALEKKNDDKLMPDEDGRICIYCDIIKGGEGEITLDGVSLRSRKINRGEADSIANNDIPISRTDGGYCFGRRPAMYQLFYIKSDETFIKRGAIVNVSLDIAAIVQSSVSGEPQYEFTRRVIDKQSAVRLTPDDVFVEQVVWEYFNGSGWATLPVTGDINPFSGKSERIQELIFTVPQDMNSTLVNAEEGYYIRARVINVENHLSALPKWILPFVKSVKCSYQYSKNVPVDYICAHNNRKKTEIENAAGITDLRFTVLSPMPPNPRAMYLRFDRSIHAMPLSMFFEIRGDSPPYSKISCEVWVRDRFVQTRTIDMTQNLRYSGAMFMYISQPLTEAEFFDERGYWLRMSLSSDAGEERRATRVSDMHLNAVSAVQRRKAPEQFFNTGPYEAGKVVRLLEKPVLNCELWVDEAGEISDSEIKRLEVENPGGLITERESGELKRCWVKWDGIPSIRQAGTNERVYELDSFAGEITFGKGINGKVPPGGDLNIRAKYCYGGGAAGNRGIGAIGALIRSIPRVNGVTNITSMAGGTNRPDMDKVEKLGNKRLRHRFVPISAEDFEEITLERFERAALVKCFPGTDDKGNRAAGHVCLVVMGRDMGGRHAIFELCREIYDYLSRRADCNLVARGDLHVIPSTEMTINIEARIIPGDFDRAAVTQQKISENISQLINTVWRGRDIGDQIDLGEIYQVVKAAPNVDAILRILPEGRYTSDGYEKLTALDSNSVFPFVTVKNGVHTVRIG